VTVKTVRTKFEISTEKPRQDFIIFSSNISFENTFIGYRVVCADRRTDETILLGILQGFERGLKLSTEMKRITTFYGSETSVLHIAVGGEKEMQCKNCSK
jgi:hypothetical protein